MHAVITQSHIWFHLRRNSKVLEKHQHVTCKHIDQSKTQNTMDNFLFQKQNPIIACSRRMAQIQKKKKWQSRSGKRGSSEDTFHIILTIAREIPQKSQREKSWQDVSVNLSENIPTATETMKQKFSVYLLGMLNHIFKFLFKTSQYPFVASTCWYVYFKVFLKKTWFCKVDFLH